MCYIIIIIIIIIITIIIVILKTLVIPINRIYVGVILSEILL